MSTEEKIEYQEIIGEAKTGSYQPVRFSRVKYKNNNSTFIDIRLYQRGYDDDGEEVYFPTKTGFQFEEKHFEKVVKSWTITPSAYVHPDVMKKCFDLLAKRQFESAVLQAFKCIEISIRKKAKLSHDQYGVKLIRKVFDPQKGVLTNYDLPVSEREAQSNFIAGAYGLYKNPCSHREVEMDFYDAFERILVASKILKIVEGASFNNSNSN